jgi:hypothetical protein
MCPRTSARLVLLSGLSPGAFFCLPPREAERRSAQTKGHHLAKAPRLPLARQARLPALHRGDFSRGHRASSPDRRTISSRDPGSACALPFIRASPSHSRQPPHRGRTVTAPPGTGTRLPACRRRHPRSANWPSPEDALGERGRCAPYVKWGGCQFCWRVCKVYQHCYSNYESGLTRSNLTLRRSS